MTVLDWVTLGLIETVSVGAILWGFADWLENRRKR